MNRIKVLWVASNDLFYSTKKSTVKENKVNMSIFSVPVTFFYEYSSIHSHPQRAADKRGLCGSRVDENELWPGSDPKAINSSVRFMAVCLFSESAPYMIIFNRLSCDL